MLFCRVVVAAQGTVTRIRKKKTTVEKTVRKYNYKASGSGKGKGKGKGRRRKRSINPWRGCVISDNNLKITLRNGKIVG